MKRLFCLVALVAIIGLSLSGCGCFQQSVKGEVPPPPVVVKTPPPVVVTPAPVVAPAPVPVAPPAPIPAPAKKIKG